MGFWTKFDKDQMQKATIKELEAENAKLQADLARTRQILDRVVEALVDADEDI